MHQEGNDSGQSVVLVAIAMLVLVIFAAITVDMSSAYLGRRTAQNAADAAALAAVRQLAYQYNMGLYDDTAIKVELNNFAERNGAGDTDDTLGNAINDSVTGIYLDFDENAIGVVGENSGAPANALGVEATVQITTPAFFGGVIGYSGYPVEASATVKLNYACGDDCILPIAVPYHPFDTDDPEITCYNIWDGGENSQPSDTGNFGWLNWALQGYPHCCSEDCNSEVNTPCLRRNLDPQACTSGWIYVGDQVAGTVGAEAAVAPYLEEWRQSGEPITVVVWGPYGGQPGYSGTGSNRVFTVAGLAKMRILGYVLNNGKPVPDEKDDDYVDYETLCEDVVENGTGFRISVEFLGWAEGEPGNCRVRYGTMRTPTLTE